MNKFEQALIDIIQEQQIKLGYMKETLRLYFPLGSIEYLLNLNNWSNGMLLVALSTLNSNPA